MIIGISMGQETCLIHGQVSLNLLFIGELMAGDDDQRQIERMTSRTTVEVENEILCMEAREEVDVGEPTVVEDQQSDQQSAPQSVSQPVPTVRVGGSSGSGTRSGIGSRASETTTDDREAIRVRFTENRGQKRQGEDIEEMAARAEEQHLDADVEVPAHKTWIVEDVVGDAADAAPEQMNTLLDARERARRRCSRRLKSHSDHCAWSKVSMMMSHGVVHTLE